MISKYSWYRPDTVDMAALVALVALLRHIAVTHLAIGLRVPLTDPPCLPVLLPHSLVGT